MAILAGEGLDRVAGGERWEMREDEGRRWRGKRKKINI
jgi:hypothetical protein